MMSSKNSKITMSKTARERKITSARKEGIRMYTIVADVRGGGRPKYYFASGVGSFRIGSMHKCSGITELKSLLK